MQYTIRNVPKALDRALRERARVEEKSLNEVTLWALARGAGFDDSGIRFRSLEDLAGTWKEDRAFDLAIVDQDTVDPEFWR